MHGLTQRSPDLTTVQFSNTRRYRSYRGESRQKARRQRKCVAIMQRCALGLSPQGLGLHASAEASPNLQPQDLQKPLGHMRPARSVAFNCKVGRGSIRTGTNCSRALPMRPRQRRRRQHQRPHYDTRRLDRRCGAPHPQSHGQNLRDRNRRRNDRLRRSDLQTDR